MDLLLGDEGGALAVHGVVGEVVGEGFDSLPHRVSGHAVGNLHKNVSDEWLRACACANVCVQAAQE